MNINSKSSRCLLGWWLRLGVITTILLLIWFLIITLPSPAWSRVVFQKDSLYSHIRVEDKGGFRTLYFNTFPQTTMSLRDPSAGGMEYAELFHSALAFQPQLKQVLVLGLGGGSIPKAFLARYPDMKVDTVEIDPVIVEVAQNYFYLPTTARHRIFLEDARRYLSRSSQCYDAIFADAYLCDYYGGYVPFHLATKEFFQLVRSRLNPGGVFGYNVIGQIGGWNDRSLRALYRTMSEVFGTLYLLPAHSTMNVVIMGTVESPPPSLAELRMRAQAVDRARGPLPTSISAVMARAQLRSLSTHDVPLLRDDFAPIETLGLFRK